VPRAEAWRERAFELVHEGSWITGVLDRVVVEYDQSNQAMRATVYDFKTDMDEAAVMTRHRGQMSLYRQAVARLTGLAPAQVGVHLVLTGSQRLLTMPLSD
jgi:hypothetical protein